MNRLTLLPLLLLAAACAHAPAPQSAQPNIGAPADLAITHVYVIDVTDGAVLTDRTVLLSGNRISAVGPSRDVAVPQGTRVVDATGKYVIPGLWDMHTHLLWTTDESEHFWVKMARDLDAWTLWERYYAPALDLMIANGVTGIREMWGNLEIARRVQAEAAAAVRLAPRIIIAGHQLDGSPPIWPGELVATTPERGRALVDSLAQAGADFIKVYSHLPPEVYFAILERARERGIPVVGHVPYRVPASAAAEAGQRSFEHLIGVVQGCSSEEDRLITLSQDQIEAAGREDHERVAELDREWKVRVLATQDDGRCRRLLETLARNRTWQVPTHVTNRGIAYQNDPDFAADPRLKYITPAWRDSWLPENDPYLLSTEEGYQLRRRHHARKLEITGLALMIGVPILAGSDTPNAFAFPGFGLHDELALLVEAGLSPLSALQAATLNAARYLEATDSLGTVDAGKLADLVLLDANPLEDIRNTQGIAGVVLNGRYLDRQALDALLVSAARHAAKPASLIEVQEAEVPRTRTLPGIASPAFPYAHPEEVGLSSEKLERLGEEMVSWVAAGDLVGAELLIVKDGRAVFHEAYGWSDREARKPVSRNSIWSIQSMSKPFTATAVLMLAGEGKLGLDDPVSRYIPGFAGDPRTTIRHLLSHTTGYLDPGVGDPSFAHASYADWVEDWASQVPDGTFGEFSYTDFGFAAAGYIVEAVSGLPIDQFTEQRIIAPLRLADTSAGFSDDRAWRARVNPWYRWNAEAGVYHFRWSEHKPAYAFYPAAAGMFSTAMDYAAFMAMWLNRGTWQGVRLLSPAVVEEALAEHGRDGWGGGGYGYGWELEPEPALDGMPAAFGHGGGDGTIGVAFPAINAMVLLLTHSRNGPHIDALLEALGMLETFDHPGYGRIRPDERATGSVELSRAARRRYVGTYADREETPRWVAHVHDEGEILHLRVTRPGGHASWLWAHLVPLGDDRFGYGTYDGTRLRALHSHRQVEFEFEDGRSAAMRIVSGADTLLRARRTDADRILADARRHRDQVPVASLLAGWLKDEGIERAREHFRALRESGPDSVRFNEFELGALGLRLLREETRVPEAIAVFEMTTAALPDSPGAWDGLGDAYRTADRLEDARRSYARAVDLAERQRHGDLPVFRRKLEWLSRRLEVPRPPASLSDAIGANDNRTPAGAFENGTFVVHLEARTGAWRPRLDADTTISAVAFAERGHAPSIPGPLIRVPQGSDVRITVRNEIPPGFPVHRPPPRFQDVGLSSVGSDVLIVHGLRAGTVAEDTIRVPTGATREVTFRADRPGTYVYWGALTEATMEQRRTRDATLSGVIIVDPAGSAPDPAERIFVITMIDAFPDTTQAETSLDVFEPVINGLSWPHTERLEYAVADTVRWRWVNASGQEHPMHLHGFHFRTLGRSEADGEVAFTADSTYWAVTHLVEPGAMVRMEWVPTRPGNWLMHCHIDDHVVAMPDPEHGTDVHDDDDVTNHPLKMMMGMVLGITVTPDADAVDLPPRQRLRLTAQERVVPGSEVARGFVLEGGRQPSAFSSPGPPLILMRDETTQITVVNGIAQPTSIHWHGMELESVYDGVAGWARTGSRIAPLIAPGDSFIVQMTPPRAGTYMYHTHMGHTDQLVSGLYGPLIVLEPGQTFDPDIDLLFLVGGAVYEGEHWQVTLNGRMEPPPRELRAGTRYRLRFMNISPGSTVEVWLEDENGSVPWTALAVDGADLSDALRVEETRRLRFNAGQTFDFHWTPAAAGSVTLVLHHIFATFPGSYTIRQPLEIR
jgi:manganese oxidase